MGMEVETTTKHLIFTYGTLKHGFSNHCLIQDLIGTNDAVYIGPHQTTQKYPLVCGPYRVPFLLDFPGLGHQVRGELYAVSRFGLTRMDELEGITRGHYERLPIEVGPAAGDGGICKAEAYYAHRSFAEEMWKKNGEKGFGEYTEEVAKGYVKRKDRPRDVAFVDQIRLFVSSSPETDDCH